MFFRLFVCMFCMFCVFRSCLSAVILPDFQFFICRLIGYQMACSNQEAANLSAMDASVVADVLIDVASASSVAANDDE